MQIIIIIIVMKATTPPTMPMMRESMLAKVDLFWLAADAAVRSSVSLLVAPGRRVVVDSGLQMMSGSASSSATLLAEVEE
jgi:hypothetical protein